MQRLQSGEGGRRSGDDYVKSGMNWADPDGDDTIVLAPGDDVAKGKHGGETSYAGMETMIEWWGTVKTIASQGGAGERYRLNGEAISWCRRPSATPHHVRISEAIGSSDKPVDETASPH